MSRRFFLEQVDDAAVVQYYADGFEALPLDQKILAWHLYNAALTGRDIYYDQRYRHGLEMREILEEILTHHPAARRASPEVPASAAIGEIRRYAKLFWINSGPYGSMTARKFVLKCTREQLSAVAHEAAQHGASFPLKERETLDGLLARLDGAFFDEHVEAMVTSKTPANGEDILAASANNLYHGVTMADIADFDERFAMNSRLVRSGSTLVEEVYRVHGRYGHEIAEITSHLRSALPYASAPMRRALEALIRFYESGEDRDRAAYDIAWVEDASSPVDTINGFIETYLDARGVKGAWEGIVCYVNEEKTTGLARLAENAGWFEARLPIDPQWRREDVVGVTARAIDVIVETGDAGPITAIGINLPNDQFVRERHGSKSVSLANINEAYEKSQPPAYRREFCWSEEEVERAERWGALAGELVTAIHEVLGHGSGRVAEHLEGQPQLVLKEYYSAVEEARADLVALYFMPEPRLAEIGMVPADAQQEVVQAEYEAYARNAIIQLRRVRVGTTIEEDHMRNRQMIVQWLLAHTTAIQVQRRDDRTYYVMTDAEEFRAGVARLLREVQRIKSEGDYEGARDLFEAYGIHFHPDLRDEVIRRVEALNLPSYTGFVQPRLRPVMNDEGRILDVRIEYPLDLEAQMLEYAGKR
jgi:dipeptidyl-peptidase-3